MARVSAEASADRSRSEYASASAIAACAAAKDHDVSISLITDATKPCSIGRAENTATATRPTTIAAAAAT